MSIQPVNQYQLHLGTKSRTSSVSWGLRGIITYVIYDRETGKRAKWMLKDKVVIEAVRRPWAFGEWNCNFKHSSTKIISTFSPRYQKSYLLEHLQLTLRSSIETWKKHLLILLHSKQHGLFNLCEQQWHFSVVEINYGKSRVSKLLMVIGSDKSNWRSCTNVLPAEWLPRDPCFLQSHLWQTLSYGPFLSLQFRTFCRFVSFLLRIH